MPETVEKIGKIVKNKEICNGAPVVAGTRTRVIDIAIASEHKGMNPDEIVEYYPQLDLKDVHAALAYYYKNIDEMKEALKEKDRTGA